MPRHLASLPALAAKKPAGNSLTGEIRLRQQSTTRHDSHAALSSEMTAEKKANPPITSLPTPSPYDNPHVRIRSKRRHPEITATGEVQYPSVGDNLGGPSPRVLASTTTRIDTHWIHRPNVMHIFDRSWLQSAAASGTGNEEKSNWSTSPTSVQHITSSDNQQKPSLSTRWTHSPDTVIQRIDSHDAHRRLQRKKLNHVRQNLSPTSSHSAANTNASQGTGSLVSLCRQYILTHPPDQKIYHRLPPIPTKYVHPLSIEWSLYHQQKLMQRHLQRQRQQQRQIQLQTRMQRNPFQKQLQAQRPVVNSGNEDDDSRPCHSYPYPSRHEARSPSATAEASKSILKAYKRVVDAKISAARGPALSHGNHHPRRHASMAGDLTRADPATEILQFDQDVLPAPVTPDDGAPPENSPPAPSCTDGRVRLPSLSDRHSQVEHKPGVVDELTMAGISLPAIKNRVVSWLQSEQDLNHKLDTVIAKKDYLQQRARVLIFNEWERKYSKPPSVHFNSKAKVPSLALP